MTTYAIATDELNAIVFDAIQSGSIAILGYIPEIRWQHTEKPAVPDAGVYWVQVSRRNIDENQSTISSLVGKPGGQNYETFGVQVINIFAPKLDAEAGAKLAALSMLIRDAYRGVKSPSGIWFRSATSRERNPEGSWYTNTVSVDYIYNENK